MMTYEDREEANTNVNGEVQPPEIRHWLALISDNYPGLGIDAVSPTPTIDLVGGRQQRSQCLTSVHCRRNFGNPICLHVGGNIWNKAKQTRLSCQNVLCFSCNYYKQYATSLPFPRKKKKQRNPQELLAMYSTVNWKH